MPTLTITQGSAASPSDPFGQEVLALDTDGRFSYTRTRFDTVQRAGGVTPSLVEELIAGLVAAGFPDPPPHRIPPGASLVTIQFDADGEQQRASVHLHSARRWEGYGPVIRLAEAWCGWLRSDGGGAPPQGMRPD